MKYRLSLLLLLFTLFQVLKAQTLPYKDTVFTEYFRRTGPGWVASDATISVPLPNGKVIWLFGDTNLDGYNAADTTMPCLFQVRNSMMVQDATDRNGFVTILDNTKTGVNRTPVKLVDNDTTLFWPGHGFVKGDTAYVFWHRYHSTRLTPLGVYISKIYWPTFTDASSIVSLTPVPHPLNGIEFGVSVLIDSASHYAYIYGFKQNWIIFEPYVARCSLNNILGTWEFYNGTGWTTDANAAQKVSGGNDYVSPSYSVIKHENKYYLITQDIGFLTCGLGRKIFALSSDTPYGPFTNKRTIYVMKDKYKGVYMVTYNSTAHPEFTANNELLISYNVNNICPTECKNGRYNADLYRAKFVRVPFAILDTGIVVSPEASFIATPTSGKPPLTVSFDASGSITDGDIEYSWDFGDGGTGTGRLATHTYSTARDYIAKSIIRDVTNGLSDTASLAIQVKEAIKPPVTGIEAEETVAFRVYPNPASSRGFTIETGTSTLLHPIQIVLRNVLGQEVLKESLRSIKNTIQVNKEGIYFLHLGYGSYREVKKIVIQE